MVKDKPLRVILWSVGLALGLVLSLAIGGVGFSQPVNAANAYDISGYQGYVNDNQASQLKNEVNFMILKAENGGLYTDSQFNHNAYEMESHNIPYGAYDYSLYADPAQAQSEAQALYQRAPQAQFYINDSEENDAGDQYNDSTQAWANEIHQLTHKPAILYSGLYFMNNNTTPQTRNAYDGLWIAAYGSEPNPAYHYDLWQYTDHQYSPALGQSVDASVVPDGATKPMSFWTGNGNDDSKGTVINNQIIHHRRHHVRKHHMPSVVTNNANQNNHNANAQLNRKILKARQRKARKAFLRKLRRQASKASKRASKLYSKVKKNLWTHKILRRTYNPHYYRSKHVKFLRVIGSNGINLYTTQGQYFGHVDPGTILNVYRFIPVYHHSTGYMTKAVGIHYGRHDLYTSRKDLVQWYVPGENQSTNDQNN